jgi:hypothetical protein
MRVSPLFDEIKETAWVDSRKQRFNVPVRYSFEPQTATPVFPLIFLPSSERTFVYERDKRSKQREISDYEP